MLRLILSFSIVVLWHIQVCGQGFIPVFPGFEGSDLLIKLKEEYRPFVVLTYKDAREVMYRELFNRNDSVECVYSGHKVYLDPKTSDPIAYLYRNGAADGINCEHTFPQSLGAADGNARSDMHHLFPARSAVNEARSNLPYAEIEDQTTERWYFQNTVITRIPAMNIDAYSEYVKTAFEPREEHKGNVARAMFYFATIYRDQADTVWFESQLEDLCKWHLQDPVDEAEWQRNNRIAEFQYGKHNPFILDCTLANRCFCPDEPSCNPPTSSFDHQAEQFGIHPVGGTGQIWNLHAPANYPITIQIINIQGVVTLETQRTTLQMEEKLIFQEQLQPGWYAIRLLDQNTGQTLYARPFIVASPH